MQSCLTCKYEPDWSEPTGGEFSRQHGKCKYKMKWPAMPWVYYINIRSLVRYSDNSGLPTSCETWAEK